MLPTLTVSGEAFWHDNSAESSTHATAVVLGVLDPR